MTFEDLSAQKSTGIGETVIALAWFPRGEYETAIERWSSLAEDWGDITHTDYCWRMDGGIKWMRANGVPAGAIAPIFVEDLISGVRSTTRTPRRHAPNTPPT